MYLTRDRDRDMYHGYDGSTNDIRTGIYTYTSLQPASYIP